MGRLKAAMRVGVYDGSQKAEWDEFVLGSKNGTFLFFRDYMDYHSDRFVDHSLLIRDERDRVVALLPANKSGDVLISHGGLTYGGLITDERMSITRILEVFDSMLSYLRQQEYVRLIYKAMPHIYHRVPSEEDSYALFRCGATLYRRDVTTTVTPSEQLRFEKRRERAIRKARAAGVSCGPSCNYERFWQLLEQNLWSAHKLKPVHALTEIRQLHRSFPENVKLFCSFLGDEPVAGTVIYDSRNVAHAQYTATSDLGRSIGALDLLFFELITGVYKDKRYFDFGVSTEDDGCYLNSGLADFKEGFGGRTVTHDFYEIDLALKGAR
jgi:hypothetical protein